MEGLMLLSKLPFISEREPQLYLENLTEEDVKREPLNI